MKTSLTRWFAAVVAVAAFVLGASVAQATTAHLASIHTPAQVRALLAHVHSTTQLERTLRRLTPASRAYVIKRGFMPHKVVFSRKSSGGAETSPTSSSSCVSFSHSTVGTATVYSWVGVKLYEYHSAWQWGGMCYVWSAHHQEWGDNLFLGWSYDGSSYGSPYGSLGTPMIGRQTFGNFSFFKYGAHDVVDAIMKVYGGWGQFPYGDWWWWSVSGPATDGGGLRHISVGPIGQRL